MISIIKIFRKKHNSTKSKFTTIYEKNIFEGDDSISGQGSNLLQTETIRKEIPQLLKELSITTFVDAPCGDFFWMREAQLGVKKYIGIDIVEGLIKKNNSSYQNQQREFLCLDIIKDKLPKADIIFCRDCLVHLNFDQAKQAIANFKRSGSTYLLTTTFTNRAENIDLMKDDIWRTLNLQLQPFNFPAPLKLINENCTEGGGAYADKSLGLWLLKDL